MTPSSAQQVWKHCGKSLVYDVFCDAHPLCSFIAVDNDHPEEPYIVILWEVLERVFLSDNLASTDRACKSTVAFLKHPTNSRLIFKIALPGINAH